MNYYNILIKWCGKWCRNDKWCIDYSAQVDQSFRLC